MSEDEKHDASQAQQQVSAPQLPNLSARKLEKLRQKDARRGVVYISRIPPHLVSALRGAERAAAHAAVLSALDGFIALQLFYRSPRNCDRCWSSMRRSAGCTWRRKVWRRCRQRIRNWSQHALQPVYWEYHQIL